MLQVLQSLRTGQTSLTDVPCPSVGRGSVLVRTSRTLISVGTEHMLLEFGKAGWIEKARSQPDKVRMVIDKVRTDGLLPTLESGRNKLDQPLALGYCNAGTVLETGAAVQGFGIGDRVVSNGKHAEVVTVPMNLCARVPDAVSDDEAAFTVVGAIALQGIRLVAPTLGETVAVTGLGLIGLLAVQLLRAHGCRVVGLDFDPAKLELARQFGAATVNLAAGEDPVAAATAFSRGRGVDAVIITAATKSNDPVHQAALMCRKRGRIVLVGVAGLELSRADFYEKELSFQVSCSYGPGRYDPHYEEKGHDYPIGFARWTEQRNFEAVLDMMATGQLHVKPLISHRFAIADAARAYELVGSGEPSLGILLEYPTPDAKPDRDLRAANATLVQAPSGAQQPSVALIGAGNYATAVLIPAFKDAGARLRTIVSGGGARAVHAGRTYGPATPIPYCLPGSAGDFLWPSEISIRDDDGVAGQHEIGELDLDFLLLATENADDVDAARGAAVGDAAGQRRACITVVSEPRSVVARWGPGRPPHLDPPRRGRGRAWVTTTPGGSRHATNFLSAKAMSTPSVLEDDAGRRGHTMTAASIPTAHQIATRPTSFQVLIPRTSNKRGSVLAPGAIPNERGHNPVTAPSQPHWNRPGTCPPDDNCVRFSNTP